MSKTTKIILTLLTLAIVIDGYKMYKQLDKPELKKHKTKSGLYYQ